ncbi:hypothetical protein ACI2KO_13400 [Pseudomonas piscis]|uniref:hypothetical protein n=1 Tax=Pseudomonas piscis TaxID=2614538 RepID=UPI0038504875
MKKSLNKPYFLPMLFWLALSGVLLLLYGLGSAEVPELIYLSVQPLSLLVVFAFSITCAAGPSSRFSRSPRWVGRRWTTAG